MSRCLELALLGAGHVAPNPMVGAVLLYTDAATGEERIIGEGYHERYGEKHAEVNCIDAVKEADRPLIEKSTLFVSLEPCVHYGKQPPCADLIIEKRIPRVIAGCRDPFPEVNGKGIEKLRGAGVDVQVGLLERACKELNRRFFTANTLHRPYIILKWAQTADGKIAGPGRRFISNEYSNRLVHRWRAEESAILVGTATAMLDDPALTVRLWDGVNPVRLVVDKELRLPHSLQLFDGKVRTIVFNRIKHGEAGGVEYYQISPDSSLVHQLSMALAQLKLQSVLVEGGAMLLQSFIDEGYWDEARVITNNELLIPAGLAAPVLAGASLEREECLSGDSIRIYFNRPVPGRGWANG
ncbi:MAG TPA: bifunctional diaminohydroxyphosphoribosylaminopyrimidine deaminase/5-amino-6-(5-phosphoribosylamino)uracil reductase RibD [Puia sp.]|nr:bifunctional diaminohydroxyphosphoribosylaminopyrimidine deaminase/5-amino-6-(5-phosphoribosylamino)uracil reductase RibD [Puia sp.]